MKLAARLAYTPIKYESDHRQHGPSLELPRRHHWKRIMAYVYCPVCELTARVRDDGSLIGTDVSGDDLELMRVNGCGGKRAANIRKRNRSNHQTRAQFHHKRP